MNSNWSYSPETPNLGQIRWLFSRVNLQFDVWTWKTIGHLFYGTWSFVHHFVAIGDFKLEIQSGNAQFGSKSTIYIAVWPCNWRMTLKTIGHLFYATSSLVHHFVAIGEFKLESQSGNAQFGSKSTILLALWPCNLTYDLKNNRAIFLFYFQALCIIS